MEMETHRKTCTDDIDVDESKNSLAFIENKYPMLEFQKQIFMDIFEKDALVIMAKGLNYNTIIANLMWVYKDASNLVLVINSNEHEEKYFSEKFQLTALPNLGAERKKVYLEGGVHLVSTRILVVDLLKNRVPISHISGIIVLRAHNVLESCQEAFALRLYRQKNKTGFIKAFSNSPISFTFGYHQVEKVMRALFLTELFLWPRFHGAIIKNLKYRQAQVVELHVPLTTNMTHIQGCLLDIMNYTVKQLKSINRTIDLQEISIENCLTKKFHKILQSQLDCVWNQLSTRMKEYIQDLKVLRSMIISLIHDDAVSFYALVSKYRTPEYAKINSGWILLDSAEELFRLARSRVFNNKNEFDPEFSPKWKCLSSLLTEEIPEEVKKDKEGNLNKTKILVLCQDNRTCYQLNNYLMMGPSRYLFYMAFKTDITVTAVASKYKKLKNTIPIESQEENKKNAEAKLKTTIDSEENNVEDGAVLDSVKSNYVLTLTQADVERDIKKEHDESIFEPISQLDNLDITQMEIDKPVIFIQTFKENGNTFSLENTLEVLKPEYIILYHCDVSAVRQIELYESKKKQEDQACKIYFLIHDKTVEEQAYLTSLKREKQAFELLIQAKSVMVVPSYQDGKTDEYFNLNVEEEVEDAVNTRKAGGQSKGPKEKPVIIVDMREFRSDLPSLLHKKGINIEPVTIAIGDYILTPDICVERKSISDLIGSLNSGRLYTQCTQMSRNYSRPILLIEFDQNKPFNLQGHYVVSTDTAGADIQQKLQLLTIHFPRLKLVWSPSPYATAELFYELKQGRQNPNIEEALAHSSENAADDMQHERYNTSIHDFVQKLPGVTTKNITRLMNKGVSLDHLITLTLEQLTDIIENKNEAETLHSILHVKALPQDATNQNEKPFGKKKFTGKFYTK